MSYKNKHVPKEKLEFKLGDRVKCTAVLKRKNRSKYERQNIDVREGIYIGSRVVSDGYMDSDCDDYGYVLGRYYVPEKYYRVALVVFDEKTNPVYAPLDALVKKVTLPVRPSNLIPKRIKKLR